MSRFRQSQSSVHTWSGLVVGWVLFAIFLCGTVSYWRQDINRWMRPELGASATRAELVEGAIAFLRRAAPDAKSWFITVPEEGEAATHVFWQPQPEKGAAPRRGRRGDTQALVGVNGERAGVRETRGGDFLYRFHFDLHYIPVIWARWLVSFCAMMMLVAIVTGVITHKKIFADFFTFRRDKGQRTWLDGHNATAVLALPFHLMITYTGLVTLVTMLMPWAVVANYKNPETLFDALFPGSAEVERSGRPAPLVDVAPLLARAERGWGRAAGSISVAQPGDAAARVTITASQSGGVSIRRPIIAFSGVTGVETWRSPDPGGAAQVAGTLVGLHAGRYASDLLRWLYFLSGLAGSVMIASGLVLWTVKRREKLPDPARPHFGFRLVERLNIGFVGGLPVAIAGFLWANRLLPVTVAARGDTEINAMFLVWAAALGAAFLLPPRFGWRLLLGGCGAMLLVLPLHDMTGSRGLIRSFQLSDNRMVAMNLVLLVLGLCFVLAAEKVHRYRPRLRSGRSRRREALRPELATLEPAE